MFRGGYDCQRTIAIRIAAITLASDSAITIARFRPSKVQKVLPNVHREEPHCVSGRQTSFDLLDSP